MANKPPLHLRELARQRDYYNPLRGLDMPRVVRLLEDGERGLHSDLQWLYRSMEKRDATVMALKKRRLSALKKLDWDIKVRSDLPPGVSKAQANAQAEYLRAAYEQIENLPDAIEFLALASFRGFSHLEKRFEDDNPSLPVIRLQPVPQWHWVRHHETWDWLYDPRAENNWSAGVPIDPANFIIREVEDPINEIALIAFLRKNMSQKDWDAFLEDFGIPSIFILLSQATPGDKVKEWLAVAEKVTGNSRGALPPGSDVKTVAHGAQGETPFKSHKDEQREEVVLAGTGGLLSMLTAPTGMNSGQADAHEAAFNAIALAEAAVVNSNFQTQFDKPLLEREFPGQPQVAYFELAAVDQEDRASLADLLAKLAQASLEADENQISEKLGLKLRKKVPAPMPADPTAAAQPAGFKNRQTAIEAGREARFEAASAAALAAADRAALKPAQDRVAALLGITDDAEFEKAYTAFLADLPKLEAQCLGDDATAELEEAFSEIIGTALVSGAAEAAEKRAQKAAKTPEGVSGPSPTAQKHS